MYRLVTIQEFYFLNTDSMIFVGLRKSSASVPGSYAFLTKYKRIVYVTDKPVCPSVLLSFRVFFLPSFWDL
jgi:hypothetical protein